MKVDEEFLLSPREAKIWRQLTIDEMFYCNQVKEIGNEETIGVSSEALKPSARRRLYSEERTEHGD